MIWCANAISIFWLLHDFQSVTGFTKLGLVASNFMKALTDMFVSFSFAFVNICPLSSDRQHYEIDDCLEENREELLLRYICTIIIGCSYNL